MSLPLLRCGRPISLRFASLQTPNVVLRPASTDSGAHTSKSNDGTNDKSNKEDVKKPKKTMAELDEELRMKLEGRSGEGGAAGLELEGGKPVAMKRGVRENMFRLI